MASLVTSNEVVLGIKVKNVSAMITDHGGHVGF